jgi:DNA-binding HxlR family transcriptional regulator
MDMETYTNLEGLSPKDRILYLLSTDVLTSSEMAEIIGVTRQSVNWNLAQLEQKKLVKRKGRSNRKNGGIVYYWTLGTGSTVKPLVRKENENAGVPKVRRNSCAPNEVPKATNWLGGYCVRPE